MDTITQNVHSSPRNYSVMTSIVPRFGADHIWTKQDPQVMRTAGAARYNTDTGSKTTIATQVQKSPIRYSTMKSKVPRFKSQLRDGYDEELKKCLASLDYHVNSGSKTDLQTTIKKSPNRMSKSFRSKVPRFSDLPTNKDPQLFKSLASLDYDVASVSKNIAKSVAESKIKYSNVRTSTSRWGRDHKEEHMKSLGPGYYDPNPINLQSRPRTAIITKSNRFQEKQDPSQFLGSTYTLERDTREWNRKGFFTSCSARNTFTPAKIVDQIYNTDRGQKASIAVAVNSSPRHFSSMNSKSPRMAPLSIFKSGLTKFVGEVKEPYDTSALGPGAYNFSITVDGSPSSVGPRDVSRPLPIFHSRSPRFPLYPPGKDKDLVSTIQELDYNTDQYNTINYNLHSTSRSFSSMRSTIDRNIY